IRQGGKTPKEGEILPPFAIQVDGGIHPETAKACKEAGANVFVSGNYLYGAKDMRKAIAELRSI
ncbi:MAG: ribulose-phosphate 3-epimerase, partial [Chlamydiae bacterium]|nr:ribulose-phosphate 3-epimerase [Chlamydiota bacterium]